MSHSKQKIEIKDLVVGMTMVSVSLFSHYHSPNSFSSIFPSLTLHKSPYSLSPFLLFPLVIFTPTLLKPQLFARVFSVERRMTEVIKGRICSYRVVKLYDNDNVIDFILREQSFLGFFFFSLFMFLQMQNLKQQSLPEKQKEGTSSFFPEFLR